MQESYKQLNIKTGEDEHIYWYWHKMDNRQQLYLDNEDEYQVIDQLKICTIFSIDYYPSSLDRLASFLHNLLSEYGGYVSCRGSLKILYSINNIEAIVVGCP
jgi:hypothetical protein